RRATDDVKANHWRRRRPPAGSFPSDAAADRLPRTKEVRVADVAQPIDTALVAVVLDGGPTDLPESLRIQQVPTDQQKIKVQPHGAADPFDRHRPVPPATDDSPLLFHWTMRPRIAE